MPHHSSPGASRLRETRPRPASLSCQCTGHLLRARRSRGPPEGQGDRPGAGRLAANQVAGTPDEVVERLLEYQDAGAGTVYLQVLDLDDLDHIRLLSESVLPISPERPHLNTAGGRREAPRGAQVRWPMR